MATIDQFWNFQSGYASIFGRRPKILKYHSEPSHSTRVNQEWLKHEVFGFNQPHNIWTSVLRVV